MATPLEIGFAALLARNGENVTFRDEPLRVLINRAGPKRPSNLPANITLPAAAVIWFPETVQPIRGEVITDRKSIKHTVSGDIKYLGHCWEATCETNV